MKRLFRLLFTLIFFLTAYLFLERTPPEEVEAGLPPVLYSNQCQDNLQKLVLEKIRGAEKSIYLVMYTLTDRAVIKALNEKAAAGIPIEVIHDKATDPTKLHPTIQTTLAKVKGLMHQKILVVDGIDILLGSANFTYSSLKLHDNLIAGLKSPFFAEELHNQADSVTCEIGGQKIEFLSFPAKGEEGLERLTQMIEGAKKTVRVAMFTWTHPQLTEAMIAAHERGIDVDVVLDQGSAYGVSRKAFSALLLGDVPAGYSRSQELLHHKFVWIDGKTLVMGSANWTRSAFKRNADYILILHALTPKQQKKMRLLWKAIRAKKKLPDEQNLSVLGQRPKIIGDMFFEPIPIAA